MIALLALAFIFSSWVYLPSFLAASLFIAACLWIFKDLADFLFKDLKSCDEKVILKVYETLCDCNLEILNFFNDLKYPTELTIALLNNDDYKDNLKAIMTEFLHMVAKHKKKIIHSKWL